jgi:hypothetical protein
MDLRKMNPMARKLGVHTEAFSKALEDGEAEVAKAHLSEIQKGGQMRVHRGTFGNFVPGGE